MTEIAFVPLPNAFNYAALHDELYQELRLIDGVYYCTIRGLARLIGISPSSLTDGRRQVNGVPMGTLLKVKECSVDRLPLSLRPIAGFDFKNQPEELHPNNRLSCLLPEPVIAHLIKYYAYDCPNKKPRALQLDSLFASIGVRTFFAKIVDCYEGMSDIEQNPIAVAQTQEIVPISEDSSPEVSNSIDARIKAVSDILSNISSYNQEYKEKALLLLLGLI